MIFREAQTEDIAGIQRVRNSVKENQLPDPNLVPDTDVADYISRRGKGWVCEMDGTIVGFSIVSVIDRNVWALFIQPGYDKKGIGKKLHHDMLNWYFSQTNETIWFSTAPGTRAEAFYRRAGWQETGMTKSGEVKFEMTAHKWSSLTG